MFRHTTVTNRKMLGTMTRLGLTDSIVCPAAIILPQLGAGSGMP